MILVDTSVWAAHLRKAEPILIQQLEQSRVLMHSSIIGELACGNIANRLERLRDWHALPAIPELKNGDVLTLIESQKLMGRGIGLTDAHLLGAVLKHPGSLLWTRDKRLRVIAEECSVSFSE